MADKDKHKDKITITINGKLYEVTVKHMTGAELKTLGHVPSGETLYEITHNNKQKTISDDETVDIKNGEVFESAPDGGVS